MQPYQVKYIFYILYMFMYLIHFKHNVHYTRLKEHVALDRSSWSLKSICNRLLCCKSRIQWSIQKCLEIARFSFFLWELTRSAICGSQKFYSNKWPTVLVNEVKRKIVQFGGIVVWVIVHVFYFYNIFLPMHFLTNGYKRFL